MSLKTRRLAPLSTCAVFLSLTASSAALAHVTPSPGGAAKHRLEGIRVAASDIEVFGLMASAPIAQPPGDLDFLPKIIEAYRKRDFSEADIFESKLADPAALALAEWVAIRTGAPLGFGRLRAFTEDYPDWPVTSLVRRRMEEALLRNRVGASEVRAFFAGDGPMSGAGRIALAFALLEDGKPTEAADLVRHIWREETFGPELEKRILERFPTALAVADHRFRMERFLLKESWGAATRAAGYAGKPYETLVKARMGVFRGGKAAEKAFGAVPASLRSDSSYMFSRALFLRRKGKLVEAAEVMNKAPRDPEILADGDEWWNERRLIARTLLDKGDAKAAYAVASHHGAESPAQRIEAEFHSGWIALRFLDDAKGAAKHFAEAASIASTPISVARAAYWQGRAAEALNEDADAKRYYQLAADQPITYYGQLAREKLGLPIELRSSEPLTEDGRRAFEALTPVKALKLLQQVGEEELAISLSIELAQTLGDPARLAALAELAETHGNHRAVLSIGKIAVQRGFPLDAYAYPVAGIPDFNPIADEVEPAMVYAIARQESAFNPRAKSHAGARGLMQLMPATAKRTAQRFKVGFDVDRLIEDPAYNAKLGSAHLFELMEDWRGSHILAFASYNAGGGNVMKWVKSYGDPRKPGIDTVDWIERIPFYETRNYVQRVLENLLVYRHRLEPKLPIAEASALPKAEANALPAE